MSIWQIPSQRQVPVTLPVTLLCLQRKMPAMLTFMQNLPKQLFNLSHMLPWVQIYLIIQNLRCQLQHLDPILRLFDLPMSKLLQRL